MHFINQVICIQNENRAEKQSSQSICNERKEHTQNFRIIFLSNAIGYHLISNNSKQFGIIVL